MKRLILAALALTMVGSFIAGCSKPLPTAEEMSAKKAAEDAKRAGGTESE